MLEIAIPGRETLRLGHLVLDYNGTIAFDGALLPGVADTLRRLSGKMEIHVVTADTFGHAAEMIKDLPCRLHVLPPGNQGAAKMEYVQVLGPSLCACIGNGRNDRVMLANAALGIAVIQGEGAAVESVMTAKVACTDILSALELLLHPQRLVATLRD